MKSDKGPRLDGLPPLFFQSFWPLIRHDLIRLCNVAYKVITKVLVLRVQTIMTRVITLYPNGFVKGRSISDNVFLASEIMSYIHKARKLKTSWCAFKIDIHKAYDKSSWSLNTSRVVKDCLAQNLGVTISTKIGRYLGTFVDNRQNILFRLADDNLLQEELHELPDTLKSTEQKIHLLQLDKDDSGKVSIPVTLEDANKFFPGSPVPIPSVVVS
ncbi:uncharacterized protein G2W53_041075 [Senna tora]|uniref:Reverse transcriptase domain-containing protein n=1 Tax=Senna tora TaxID=362788 RepID=A0A834W2K2_9FABA|nr:uncharacterized protein G2W53_041075 [Senna tora]